VSRASTAWGLALGAGLVGAAAVAFAQSAPGGFTAAQAARGATIFNAKCALCHGEELTGGAGSPPLKGPEFLFTWKGRSVAELAAFMKEKMPPGGNDTLSDQQYADVIALVLSANGVEPGMAELPADAAGQATVRVPVP
jgi:mono/diheme cytochrome c family protein